MLEIHALSGRPSVGINANKEIIESGRGNITVQYTGDTFVSMEEGPGTDEVNLNPAHTRKLDASETRPETFQEALAEMEN